MAGHGDQRDYGGSSHDHGWSGRDQGGSEREYGGRHRGYDSDRGYGSDRGLIGERQGDRQYDRGPRRGPPTCFNCGEPMHYANQCPHPQKNLKFGRGSAGDFGESSSLSGPDRPKRPQQGDELESKVTEIGRSVAVVCQYVEMEQQKKIAKERRKAEKKEAVRRAAAERAKVELKKKKKEAKALKDAEQKEEMRKCLDIRMALRVGELRDEVREDVRDAIGWLCTVVARGKQKVAPSGSPANSASSSDTEELNLQTRDLCRTEKRKRGPEVYLRIVPRWNYLPNIHLVGLVDRATRCVE
ncbi:hypothetical protein CBR_g36614 [Chara braunii]|uniref:CCHC-type domain-containing protein n=1 Tax=Chara braunii TaxID=69332 RepID=A0A388JZC3_CHABU|nr:hypothetical protein CBR_g36614 [Chara braunii]|eukprot:GBG63127.1 hypothetical protein CBR_g36614 [Chara braunii]